VNPAGIERLRSQGIRDERVLAAAAQLERASFVPEGLRREADEDRPLPIGHGQTISQPYVVAFMTEALGLEGGERVLEVGTGSGWQTALLALLAREVWSIEIIPELAARASLVLLGELLLGNVHLRVGDGSQGWPSEAPYNVILVAAAAGSVPQALIDQLADGGRMVIPVAVSAHEPQDLRVYLRRGADVLYRSLFPVLFVPLRTG